jgi:hypothetical protein
MALPAVVKVLSAEETVTFVGDSLLTLLSSTGTKVVLHIAIMEVVVSGREDVGETSKDV